MNGPARPVAPECATARERMEFLAAESLATEAGPDPGHGELAREVEAHVSTCPHCQACLAGGAVHDTVDALLAAAPDSPPTAEEWRPIDAALAREPLPLPSRGRPGPAARFLWPALAATFVIVVLLRWIAAPVAPPDPGAAPASSRNELAMEVEILDADIEAQYMIITPEERDEPVLIIVSEI